MLWTLPYGFAYCSAWPINNGVIMAFISIFISITFTLSVIIIFLLIVIGIVMFMPCIVLYLIWSVGGIMHYPPSPPVSLAINE